MALRPVYSNLLLCENWTAGDKTLTGPTGSVTVIRDILVAELSGVLNSALYWFSPAGGRIQLWIRATSADLADWHWEGRAVLPPGESTWWHVTGGSWAIWVSGYQLPTP